MCPAEPSILEFLGLSIANATFTLSISGSASNYLSQQLFHHLAFEFQILSGRFRCAGVLFALL